MKAPFTVLAACVLLGGAMGCKKPDAKPGLHVVSTSPANGAERVNVHEPVTIRFSGPIDPGSIDANTVKSSMSRPWVDYDPDTFTLTLKPRTPHGYGSTQWVKLDRIRDPFGDSLARTEIAFKVWRNPMTRYSCRAASFMSYYRANAYDDAGRLTRST